MIKKPQAIIFDFDGTLFDSERVWRKVCLRVYRSLGMPLTEESLNETLGIHLKDSLPYWYNKYPKKDYPSISEVFERIYAEVTAEFLHGVPLREGATEVLRMAAELTPLRAISSGSPESILLPAIRGAGLEKYFSVVRSSDRDVRAKPDPAVYLSTASLLHVEPSACVALEDSPSGIASARAAGMRCIAVRDARYTSADIVASADIVVASFLDIEIDMFYISST